MTVTRGQILTGIVILLGVGFALVAARGKARWTAPPDAEAEASSGS